MLPIHRPALTETHKRRDAATREHHARSHGYSGAQRMDTLACHGDMGSQR